MILVWSSNMVVNINVRKVEHLLKWKTKEVWKGELMNIPQWETNLCPLTFKHNFQTLFYIASNANVSSMGLTLIQVLAVIIYAVNYTALTGWCYFANKRSKYLPILQSFLFLFFCHTQTVIKVISIITEDTTAKPALMPAMFTIPTPSPIWNRKKI